MTVKLKATLPKTNGLDHAAEEFMANPGEKRVVLLVVKSTGYHHSNEDDEDVPELSIVRAELVPAGVESSDLMARVGDLAALRDEVDTVLDGVVIEGDFPEPPAEVAPDDEDGGDVA